MVKCSDGTLYSGITNDLKKRVLAHNFGKGAKYTRSRRPVTLVYSEKQKNKSNALIREAEVKRLDRTEKQEIIKKARKNEKKRD